MCKQTLIVYSSTLVLLSYIMQSSLDICWLNSCIDYYHMGFCVKPKVIILHLHSFTFSTFSVDHQTISKIRVNSCALNGSNIKKYRDIFSDFPCRVLNKYINILRFNNVSKYMLSNRRPQNILLLIIRFFSRI